MLHFRVTGSIHGHDFSMLIDLGSTHNIIQPRVAEFLRLPILTTPSFSVMNGNGEHITCHGKCTDVKVSFKKQNFNIPFLVLPIQGANVVLSIQWLSILGSIIADFSVPSIEFTNKGTTVKLMGEPMLTEATPKHLGRMIQTGAIMSMHAIIR